MSFANFMRSCSFWIIALPVMAIVVPIFLWSDLQGMVHYLLKKMHKRTIKKVRLLHTSIILIH